MMMMLVLPRRFFYSFFLNLQKSTWWWWLKINIITINQWIDNNYWSSSKFISKLFPNDDLMIFNNKFKFNQFSFICRQVIIIIFHSHKLLQTDIRHLLLFIHNTGSEKKIKQNKSGNPISIMVINESSHPKKITN